MEKNKVCTFNLGKDSVDYLKSKKISFYEGSIGKIVDLKYGLNNSTLTCKAGSFKPKNLHEYNTIVLDLTNEEKIEYTREDHKSYNNKTNKDYYFICHRPQNIFDPRAFVLSAYKKAFIENIEEGSILIVFCGEEETIEYQINDGYEELYESYNIYSFIDTFPSINIKYGETIKIVNGKGEIYQYLKDFNNDIKYHVTFNHPEKFIDGKYLPDPDFYPLMYSKNDEIVSFYDLIGDSAIFFFPDIKNKGEFLEGFLDSIAPSLLPKLFPDRVTGKWLEEPRYDLPNQKKLQDEKSSLIKEYEEKIDFKIKEIENNKLKYQFLHDLLLKTDNELVSAVIKFLNWLGFENVSDADKLNSSKLKEEDIQINTDKGLIIIEVKGIGGTSKDSDCNQIGKIKFRRARERGNFDVFAHYIVNHQRHLPAENRSNPPFTNEQIQDANNDERGLITTWQLFNLYFAVENNIISKEDARKSFYEFGLISFIPRDKNRIGKPKEIIAKHGVVILDLEDETKIRVGDKILIVYKDSFQEEVVVSIQDNGKSLDETKSGEMGLKLTNPIKKGGILYF